MNEPTSSSEERVGNTFFEFLTILVRYRKFLFWFVFIITLGTTMYAVLAPKWYKAGASVLPAEKNDLMSTISGLTSSLSKGFSASKGLAALTGKSSESDKYVAILKSGTMTNDVIRKFDLRKEYKYEDDYYEKVVKEWESNVDFQIQEEGNLTIEVLDKNPQTAADIVNYMIARLNEINTDLSVTNAKANREFMEKRYLQNVTDINNLEQDMKLFQEKYGVIAVPEQIEATVKSMSGIYADLYKKQVEVDVLQRTYGKDHPIVRNSRIEMEELQKKIDNLNAGTDPSQKDIKLLVPFKKAPDLGNKYLKIYRNLEIQYKILEFIQPLYEQAKIEEVRNTPSVLVLDRAFPPERKAKPKIMLYGLIALVGSLSLSVVIIFSSELFRKLKNGSPERYEYIRESLVNDAKKFLRRK